MADIEIRSRYLIHEGGTKFYEVVEFHNQGTARYAVVRRWGKIGARLSGGEIKIEAHADTFTCKRAADDLMASKLKRGYGQAAADFGFHEKGSRLKVGDKDFDVAVIDHYRNGDTLRALVSTLNIGIDSVGNADDADENHVICEEPAPEPERAGDWGSW